MLIAGNPLPGDIDGRGAEPYGAAIALPPINLHDDEAEAGAGAGGEDDTGEGDYLNQARDLALRNPRLTAAMLERRFKIRKSAADEIIDELRGEGLVIGG